MLDLQSVLTEIVEKITILHGRGSANDPDFTISHPDYPPLVTNPETLGKLQQMADELQQKYLVAQVQNYLYDIYFRHSQMSNQELDIAARGDRAVKNNMIDGIDIDFYPRLMQSNTSRGYCDPDWEIIAETLGGELIVVKNGLHVHIDPDQHLLPEVDRTVGAIVPIYLPPNLVGQDTYIAIGNAGLPDAESIEIYFNFTPDAAVEICRTLTIELNKLEIPFQFAVLHDPALFHRYDAGTLTLSQSHYQLVHPVLAEIYQAYQATFAAPVPLFSKQLAPGLGLVETPTSFDSFGMQRCHLVATGLVLATRRGQTTSAEKLDSIEQEFASAEINLEQPHLNLAGVVGEASLLRQTLRERNENRYWLLFG
jgi:HopA1 effector protein family